MDKNISDMVFRMKTTRNIDETVMQRLREENEGLKVDSRIFAL